MKGSKILSLAAITAVLLLCGCGTDDNIGVSEGRKGNSSSSSSKSVTTTEVTPKTTVPKIIETTTVPPDEKKPDLTLSLGERTVTLSSDDARLYCECTITDYDSGKRFSYKGDKLNKDGIFDALKELDLSGCETVSENKDVINVKHTMTLSDKGPFIHISVGEVTVYGSDDLGMPTEGREPAVSVVVHDGRERTVTRYMIPSKTAEKLNSAIEKAVASEENLKMTEYLTDKSYYAKTENEYPKDNIVFVSSHSNYAEMPVWRGSFIDINGYVYRFDLSERRDITKEMRKRMGDDSISHDKAFLDTLYYEFYYKNKPIGKTDKKTVEECMLKSTEINKNAPFETHNEMWDYGSDCLYIVDKTSGEKPLIKLREGGDNVGELDDKTAAELIKAYDSLEKEDI